MKIGAKLGIGVGVLVVLLISMGVASTLILRNVGHDVAYLVDSDLPLERTALEMQGLAERTAKEVFTFLRNHDPALLQEVASYQQEFETLRQQYTALTDTSRERELGGRLAAIYNSISTKGSELMTVEKQIQAETADMHKRAENIERSGLHFKQTGEVTDTGRLQSLAVMSVALESGLADLERYLSEQRVEAKNDMKENFQAFSSAADQYGAGQLSSSERAAHEKLVRDFREFQTAVSEIIKKAEHRLELADSLEAEVNEMHKSLDRDILPEINKMAEHSRNAAAFASWLSLVFSIIGGIAGCVVWIYVRRISRVMQEGAFQVAGAATEINSAAQEQSSGASEQSSAIQEASATVEELAGAAQRIAENARKVSDAAERTLGSMGEIQAKVDDTAKKILALGEKSQSIGNIVRLIDDLAEQTNLLALNAAIEASHAGEAGRGFAVVASEVRKLSERSRESTEEIRALITEIQSETNSAVMGVEQSTKQVEEGLSLVRESVQQAKQITLATNQQRSAADQVVIAIKNIDQVSKQFVVSTKQAASAAHQLGEHAQQLKILLGENRNGH